MDLIKELGALILGSRISRLVDRMNRDISRFYRALGAGFEARWFPILYLLGKQSPQTITGIANELGISHPAVIKLVSQMSRAGLVTSTRGKEDKRKRLIDLTQKGQETRSLLSPFWDEIRLVVSNLLTESDHDFLGALEGIENLLDEKCLYKRLTENAKQRLLGDIEILDYRPAYKKHFKALNYEWLEEHFRVEAHDEEILSDPTGKIIRRGGLVLFARVRNRIVGTCALIKHKGEVFELAKLAVARDIRGRFVGTRLATVIIDEAKQLGAKTLYAESSPKIKHTINFFESLGFRKSESWPLPKRFRRRRLVLELDLLRRSGVNEIRSSRED